MQAVIVRPLSSVSALVRFAEEPQMFAVEFNDGCPMHVSTFHLQGDIYYFEGVKFLKYVFHFEGFK